MDSRSAAFSRRCALLLVGLSAAGAAGWLWWSCVRRPDVYFLPRQAPAEWIIYPSGPKGIAHPRLEMSTIFRRSFTLDRAPPRAILSVAGLRQYAVSINGKEVPAPVRRGRNWKQPDQFEVSADLGAGENQIAVTVMNSNGPPILWLSLDTGAGQLNSDERWQASHGGAAWRPARLASKPKIALAGSLVEGGEEPWAGVRARWLTLLLFTVPSGAACWFLNRRSRLTTDHGPRATDRGLDLGPAGAFTRELLPVLVLAGLWVALFANNLGVLPSLVGFDVEPHIAYIRYIQEHHCLPRADEGWEMFQPPLYYLLGAALLGMFSLSVTQDGGVMALRVMGLVIGIAHFVLVWASLRLLFPGERAKPGWGLLLAAALPPMLYLSQYISNEALAATLVSACVYLTLRALKRGGLSWKLSAGLGLCLGAALLTKATALLVVPVVFGALLWKTWLTPQSGISHSAFCIPRLALALGVSVIVCAWHYARLWARYGDPFIGVWDPRLGFLWWQDDGYRTTAFFLRFGTVLLHPWFSSFQSFGDGIYATLWGDGLFGGAADAVARPPWNYELMAPGYWLALVPTCGIVAGGILALAKFLRQPSPEWFLVLGLAFLATLALVRMSIVLPYQCHVKAFYGLCALVPLCAFGACGLDLLCPWSGKLRPVICILFGVWALNSFASFWVSRVSAATLSSRAQSLWKEKRGPEAIALVRAGVEREPGNIKLRSLLATLLAEKGELQEAGQQADTVVRAKPDDWRGHLVLAGALRRQKQTEAAIEHAKRAVELAPGDDRGYQQLADMLFRHERYEQAIDVAREGLVVGPLSPVLRFTLGAALVFRGETAEGIAQLQMASAIKPAWTEAHVLLGATLARQGKLEAATQHLQTAVRLEPNNADAHCRLAIAYSAQRQTAPAVAEYSEALRLHPDLAGALNNLAWIRAAHDQAEFRDGPEAVRLAERACQLTTNQVPMFIGTLAAAYAEAGRYEDAVAAARKARELALAAGQNDLVRKNEQFIELFSARRPYRKPAQP